MAQAASIQGLSPVRFRNGKDTVVARDEALFSRTAQRLMDEIIGPRLRELAGYFHFDNGRYMPPDATYPYRGRVRFGGSDHFPAQAALTVGILHHQGSSRVVIIRTLVTHPPGAVTVDGISQLIFPLAAVDFEQVADWLDETNTQLNDGFIALRTACEYGIYRRTTDPVCGIPTNQQTVYRTLHLHGQTYEFCSRRCYEQFLRNPFRYALARPS